MKNVYFYQTDIGEIGIIEKNEAIVGLSFGRNRVLEDAIERETLLLKKASRQLFEYLAKERKYFDLPFAPEGTDFMKEVWGRLCAISYGETRTYKEVAQSMGKEKACRAVGNANNCNPLPIFIPCHRVVGVGGKPVGYSGGLNIKKYLLDLEK